MNYLDKTNFVLKKHSEVECSFFKALMKGNYTEIESFVDKVNFSSFYCDNTNHNALRVLIDLSIYQNADALEVILKNEVNINQAISNGDSYLHKAARYLKYEFVYILIKYGIDVTIRNNMRETALDVAKSTSMIQHNKFSWKYNNSSTILTFVNIQIDKEKTLQLLENAMGCFFITAVTYGNPVEIENFVGQVDFNSFYCQGEQYNAMELIMISVNLNTIALEVLLRNKIDINRLLHDNNYTYLHMVAAYEAYEIAAVLIKYGIDVTLRNHLGKTALDIARSVKAEKIDKDTWIYNYGSYKLERIFMNTTIDKQKTVAVISKEVGCCFYNELIIGDYKKIEKFLDQLNPNSFFCMGVKYNSMNVLMNSTTLNTDAVKTIIKSKFNINKVSSEGDSYLHKAAFFAVYEIVDVLIKAGINITLRNNDGKTALDIANLTNVVQVNKNSWLYDDNFTPVIFTNTSVDQLKTIEILEDAINISNNCIQEKALLESFWEYWVGY